MNDHLKVFQDMARHQEKWAEQARAFAAITAVPTVNPAILDGFKRIQEAGEIAKLRMPRIDSTVLEGFKQMQEAAILALPLVEAAADRATSLLQEPTHEWRYPHPITVEREPAPPGYEWRLVQVEVEETATENEEGLEDQIGFNLT